MNKEQYLKARLEAAENVIMSTNFAEIQDEEQPVIYSVWQQLINQPEPPELSGQWPTDEFIYFIEQKLNKWNEIFNYHGIWHISDSRSEITITLHEFLKNILNEWLCDSYLPQQQVVIDWEKLKVIIGDKVMERLNFYQTTQMAWIKQFHGIKTLVIDPMDFHKIARELTDWFKSNLPKK